MANKKSKEFRNLSKDEVISKIRDAEKLYFDLRIQKSTGQLEKTSDLWKSRKDIARLKTVLGEKNKADTIGQAASR